MKRGFTLVELTTVLTIVVILAVMGGAAAWDYFERQKLDKAARKMASDLRYLQQYAISTGRWGKFDTSGTLLNYYEIEYVLTGPSDEHSIKDPLDPSKNFVVDFNNTNSPYYGVTFPNLASPNECVSSVSNDNDFFFDTKGIPWCCTGVCTPSFPASNCCGRMSQTFDVPLSYRGKTRTVTVAPETGSVRVQ